MKRRTTLVAALAVATASLSLPASAQYYKGKTITFLGGAAGGTLDLTLRIVARHLPRHVPGEPTVIVKPMPGGATLIAQNFVAEKAPTDGTMLSFNPLQALSQVIRDPGLRFGYQDVTYLAGYAEAPYLVLARTEALAPEFTAADMAKATRLVTAGRRADHVVDANTLATMDLMGLKYKYVAGYAQGKGAGDFNLGLSSGEVNVMGATSGQWLQVFAPQQPTTGRKTIAPLWQNPITDLAGKIARHASYPEVPTFLEVYRRVHGKDPSGELWDAYRYLMDLTGFANFLVFGPPKMNEEATRDLREAFTKLSADPQFRDEIAKVQGAPMALISHEFARPRLEQLRDTESQGARYWRKRIGDSVK